MKLGTKHYVVYIIVLKWLESKTKSIYLKLRSKLRFLGFLSIFCSFWFTIVLELLESKKLVTCLKFRAKLCFECF